MTAQPHAVHFSSDRMDWETPPEFFERLNAEFHLDLDVAAVAATAKCGTRVTDYFGPDHVWVNRRDGLADIAPWFGRCWMNSPYGKALTPWCAKAAREAKAGRSKVLVGLVPARTDTRWWHDSVMQAAEVRLVKGRLRFAGAKHSAPFPSAVVIWKPGHVGPPVFTTMEARL